MWDLRAAGDFGFPRRAILDEEMSTNLLKNIPKNTEPEERTPLDAAKAHMLGASGH